MIQPVEMHQTLPMALHGGALSTTTDVWEMLSASRAGDLSRVLDLIGRAPALATCQFNCTPPLHFAVREGHLDIVRALVERHAFDPRYVSYPFKDSLLTMAADRGHAAIARLLREARAEPGRTRTWVETGEVDYGHTAEQKQFEEAVHAGRTADAERMLEAHPALATDELASWAEGVLMMPAKNQHRPMLELLMGRGAQVPTLSKWGRFYYFEHADIAALLLERGMSAGHQTWLGVTLLHDMAQHGDLAKARLLIDHGADIDAIDDEYRSTPLGLAARWGQREIVRLLLDHGADPNAAGADWSRPLAWARKKSHAAVAEDLRAAGATE